MTFQYLRYHTVPCVMMRGGTTRGFFFQRKDVPSKPSVRDQMFLDIVAGHDLHQADGLGGNDMLLNKVVSVWASDRKDADVDCVFGVITPGSERVKYGSNCGNLVSAVALYAIQENLAKGLKDTVRIFNPQSDSHVLARFMEEVEFHERIARVKSLGMSMTGEPVELTFIEPASTIGRGVLPSGRSIDRLSLESGVEIEVSIVDSGTVYVFVSAKDVGLDYATAKLSSQQQSGVLAALERLRGQAAVLCGLAERSEDARRTTPAVPKISIVSQPRRYLPENGGVAIDAGDIDILGRIVSSQQFHKGYSVTGALATIAAAVIPDSIVNRAVGDAAATSPLALRIGHASGIIEPRQTWHPTGDGVSIDRAYMIRTTRRLLTGRAYVSNLVTAPRPDLQTTEIPT